MSVPLARRQLLARKGRTLAGLAGIAVALLLVLALKAILAGMEGRLTGYIDRSGADVIVAQEGVRTMHMTQSVLPLRTATAIAAVAGVARATPIVYVPTMLERGEKRSLVYLIGEDPAALTLPLVSGRRARAGEIVVDEALASLIGALPGTTVMSLGRRFRVVGQIAGTSSIASSIALADRRDLSDLLRSEGSVNYVLVRAREGVAADELARRIEQAVPVVTASTRAQFSRSERRLVGDMSTDIVRSMILVGFVIGVAVAGLVAYSATLSQLRDYAVLRALGMRARRALALVLAQVGALVVLGFALSIAFLGALAWALPALSPTLALAVHTGDVALAFAVAAAVAAAAAALPVIRVARVDPASVFRGR
ncbi:MAG: ABC transporter permease [Actinomycetota bacterium]